MSNRINVFVPEPLMARVRAARIENVSRLCQQILDAAAVAVETGRSQTVTVEVVEHVVRTIDAQRTAGEP